MSPSRSDYIFTTLGEWVWRVVSEDSFNYHPLRSLSLLAYHVHLVGLLNNFDQPMGIVMLFTIHCHHDFTKQLIVTFFTGERHVAFIERKHCLDETTSTYDRKDQYVFVATLWSDSSCLKYAPCKFEQSPPDLVLVQEKFRLYQVTKSRRFMILDRNAKTAFAFDQSCKEP